MKRSWLQCLLLTKETTEREREREEVSLEGRKRRYCYRDSDCIQWPLDAGWEEKGKTNASVHNLPHRGLVIETQGKKVKV